MMQQDHSRQSCSRGTPCSGRPAAPRGITCQHAHHRQEDLLHALHWAPPLGTALIAHGVVAWGMKDGNADSPIRVDCRGQNTPGEPGQGTCSGPRTGSGWCKAEGELGVMAHGLCAGQPYTSHPRGPGESVQASRGNAHPEGL